MGSLFPFSFSETMRQKTAFRGPNRRRRLGSASVKLNHHSSPTWPWKRDEKEKVVFSLSLLATFVVCALEFKFLAYFFWEGMKSDQDFLLGL